MAVNKETDVKLTKTKLKEIIKQELNESTTEGLVDAITDLQTVIKRIDFNKVRKWADKYHRSAPKLLGSLTNALIVLRKMK